MNDLLNLLNIQSNFIFISQIMARYNYERFSNNLPRVTPLTDLRAPIAEGYFPKLDSLIASRSWPGKITKPNKRETMLKELIHIDFLSIPSSYLGGSFKRYQPRVGSNSVRHS
jgi:hypothetical protein